MKTVRTTLTLLLIGLWLMQGCGRETGPIAADYPITPVDFTRVKLQDGFWKVWVERAVNATIPFSFQKCEETGRIDNFIFAAGIRGTGRGRIPLYALVIEGQ